MNNPTGYDRKRATTEKNKLRFFGISNDIIHVGFIISKRMIKVKDIAVSDRNFFADARKKFPVRFIGFLTSKF